jgi:hypothetical protein
MTLHPRSGTGVLARAYTGATSPSAVHASWPQWMHSCPSRSSRTKPKERSSAGSCGARASSARSASPTAEPEPLTACRSALLRPSLCARRISRPLVRSCARPDEAHPAVTRCARGLAGSASGARSEMEPLTPVGPCLVQRVADAVPCLRATQIHAEGHEAGLVRFELLAARPLRQGREQLVGPRAAAEDSESNFGFGHRRERRTERHTSFTGSLGPGHTSRPMTPRRRRPATRSSRSGQRVSARSRSALAYDPA